MQTPLSLAVDTCTGVLSVAVANGKRVLSALTGEPHLPHSQTLFQLIPRALGEADVGTQDVTVLAVTTGPGSFTGMRVGLAAMKGLAQALGRPLFGMTTLEALAWAAGQRHGTIIALVNAPRGDVFCGIFNFAESEIGGVKLNRLASDSVQAVSALTAALVSRPRGDLPGQPLIFIGDGAATHRQVLQSAAEAAGLNFELIAPGALPAAPWSVIDSLPPLAPIIAAHALSASGQTADASPHYIRPSDAEIKHSG